MRVFFLFLFISLYIFTGAQEKKITIKDLQTNKPISYATVKILHTIRGKIASVDGEFMMDIKQNDSVFITSVGYYDTLLIGKEIYNTISLTSKTKVLESIIVKAKKVINRFVLGNGASLIDKNIKCKYVPGNNNDCLPWGPGGGAEFAEPMLLPDSINFYHLSKVYIPVGKFSCLQSLFLNVYESDSSTENPGALIFRKPLSLQHTRLIKGKIIVDLSQENIYLTKLKAFFISISWDTDFSDKNCTTILYLKKSVKGISFSRHLLLPDYHWFTFDGNTLQQKEIPGRFHTLFAAEIELLEN
jgi:hypothetical protein